MPRQDPAPRQGHGVGRREDVGPARTGCRPELSGRENVFLYGSILGLTKRELERKFDTIVDFAGLERFIDTPVKNYSSGMYVRLGFSIAISVDPDVLLIDEVLAVGDEEFQRKCLERISELREAGKTILVVTHSLMTVRSMCDEAMWLEQGKVRERGRAAEVADAYLGEVHVDMQAAEAAHPRKGSGQLRITEIQMLDHMGRATEQVCTGEAVTFRLHYQASEPVAGPVFSFSIFTPDGVLVTGPNTKEATVAVGRIEGEGHVDLAVDRLLLLLGSYDLSAECTNDTVTHTYDLRQRALRFDVKPGFPHETYGGLVSLDGHWSIE